MTNRVLGRHDALRGSEPELAMKHLRTWIARFRGIFGKRELDLDCAAELESHVQMHVDENVRAGMTPEEARRQALLRLGGVEQTKEACREQRGARWLETLLQDVRFGLRMLRKNPGFAAVAVLTLALGVGANTAIYSVVDAVLLNPIPYAHADKLVSVFVKWPSYPHAAFAYPNFLDLQRQTRSLEDVAAWLRSAFTLTGIGEPEEVRGKMITANFFPLLGVRPILGRTFRTQDDQFGAEPVVILGEGLWKRRFGSDRNIVGKSVTLDGKDYTVVGVVPTVVHFLRFQDSYFDDLFVPVGQWDNPLLRNRNFSLGLRTVGRLRNGVSIHQAVAEMNRISGNLDATYPTENNGMGLGLVSLKDELISETRTSLLLLWGAVGLVLLIACANMANLLLAHASGRKEEFAIRAALGASGSRLMRQLLAESLILSVIGGALGIVLATVGNSALLRLFPGSLPAVARVETNRHVLTFAIVLCVLAGVLFSALPAFKFSKPQVHTELKEGRTTRGSHGATRAAFVATQIGLALVLLMAAGLLIRSLANVWQVKPGFDPKHLLAFGVAFSQGNLKNGEKAQTILRQLDERLASVPGVQAVGLNLGDMPLEGDSEAPFWPDDKPKPATVRQMPTALSYLVSPGYFQAMGIPLIRGRVFTESDDKANRPLMVIDEDLANAIFPKEDPLGKHIIFGPSTMPAEVIGVVGHVKHWGLDAGANEPTHYQIYSSYGNLSGPILGFVAASTSVVVRSTLPPASLVSTVRQQVNSLDSGAALYGIESMDAIISDSLASRTFSMILLSIFAAIALLLAAVGIYGVVSYVVSQRTHEIGIRMALGAQPRNILRSVFGDGGRMAAGGVLLGLAASLGLMRLMTSMLFGVGASDPVTFAMVIVILLAVTLLACWIPARRAMRVDPMVALRNE